jgi:hypothetical protein
MTVPVHVQRQGPVKKASEYRQHAKECRTLAAQAVSEEHRKQLSAMADTWDALALEREKTAAQNSDFASPGGNAAVELRATH